MAKLDVQVCPETGICSLIRPDGSKIDLMPDEAARLRAVAGKPEAMRSLLADVDAGFAGKLDARELGEIAAGLK